MLTPKQNKSPWLKIWPIPLVTNFFTPPSKEEIKAALDMNEKNAFKTRLAILKYKEVEEETKKVLAETKPANYY